MNQIIGKDIISKELDSYGYMGSCTDEFHDGFRDGVKFAETHIMWASITTNSPDEHEDVLLTNGRDYFVSNTGMKMPKSVLNVLYTTAPRGWIYHKRLKLRSTIETEIVKYALT